MSRLLDWKLAVSLVVLGLAAPRSAAAEADVKTVRTWKAKCSTCHGVDGKGDTEQGKKLGVIDLTQKKPSEADAKKALVDGKKAEGKPEGMDSFKDKLSEEQITALVGFVRELK